MNSGRRTGGIRLIPSAATKQQDAAEIAAERSDAVHLLGKAANGKSSRKERKKKPKKQIGDPTGIRTRVPAVKGRCPNRWTIGSLQIN